MISSGWFAVSICSSSSFHYQAEINMKKFTIAFSFALSFVIPSFAFADQTACESKAGSKDGKPLYGTAKVAFIKKCEGGA